MNIAQQAPQICFLQDIEHSALPTSVRRASRIAVALASTLLTGACGLSSLTESPLNRDIGSQIDKLASFQTTEVVIAAGTTIRLDPRTINKDSKIFPKKYDANGIEIISNACTIGTTGTTGTTNEKILLPGMKLIVKSEPRSGPWTGLPWDQLPQTITDACPETDADGVAWAISEKISFGTINEAAEQDALQKISDAADSRVGS